MVKPADCAMSSWIANVCRTTFQLEEIGGILTDEDIVLVLTNGLPPTFSQLIVSLNSTDLYLLTLDYVIACLLNEESHQSLTDPPSSSDSALATAPKKCTPIKHLCFLDSGGAYAQCMWCLEGLSIVCFYFILLLHFSLYFLTQKPYCTALRLRGGVNISARQTNIVRYSHSSIRSVSHTVLTILALFANLSI
jgi:hypothetical protein